MFSKSTYRIILFSLISLFLIRCSDNDIDEGTSISYPDLVSRINAGGGTTVYLTSSNAYSTPAPNLSSSELDTHLAGDFQFDASFVTAPATINGGVGPIFNNVSCVSCHPRDGRAAFPTDINALSGFFLRTSLGNDANNRAIPVPGFGTQLQNQAIFGFQSEVKFGVNFTEITETLADGTQVILRKPNYFITNSYIPFPAEAFLSPRIGSPIYGLGLLEAIPEANILLQQDISDANGDGISGKANYVLDAISGQIKIGRFGWKANTASIMEQIAGAYKHDMGITNPLFPQETGFGQTNGGDGLNDDPEISQEILNQVAFYCQTLGVPAFRNASDVHVKNGSRIFEEIDCVKCHIPEQKTASFPISALAFQTFYPYTDLLLHDMGDLLADNRPDGLANGNEWKTRPLWGIGLQQIVNGHTQFLHDGRAKNITEAILWHGGEAQNSKNKFKQLSSSDRNDLLRFLNSL